MVALQILFYSQGLTSAWSEFQIMLRSPDLAQGYHAVPNTPLGPLYPGKAGPRSAQPGEGGVCVGQPEI